MKYIKVINKYEGLAFTQEITKVLILFIITILNYKLCKML